jgi:serine/threonine protein kinase
MPLTPGTRLGPYTILSALGAGGMGEVYKARDVRLDRDVAIKVLASALAADARFKERFEREARVVASLNHPHICTLYDIGEHDGATFLVMEYLEGETLAAWLVRQRVPFETVLTWGIQVADALALAHGKGVVHRDLKPANIMLVRRGGPSGPPDAKVLDFGLAKAAGPPAATLAPTMAVTDAGTAVGTVAYMSPEQARGESIDARSDIFSLGAVLYRALTGEAPLALDGLADREAWARVLHAPPRLPHPRVPAALEPLLRKALAKEPERRYATAAAMGAALRAARAEVPAA